MNYRIVIRVGSDGLFRWIEVIKNAIEKETHVKIKWSEWMEIEKE